MLARPEPTEKSIDWAQIERRALEIAAVFEAKDGPYAAEILPECKPAWYMFRTVPGKENKAAKYLSARGFGVFVAKFDPGSILRAKISLDNGKSRIDLIDLSQKLIFPGRGFLFAWDILAHWRRVVGCPGVQRIVLDNACRPVIVPDTEVNRIQALQFSLTGQQSKRRRKRYRSDSEDNAPRVEMCKSYWHVDGEERNRVLDQSLGLAS